MPGELVVLEYYEVLNVDLGQNWESYNILSQNPSLIEFPNCQKSQNSSKFNNAQYKRGESHWNCIKISQIEIFH
jgi:hypothetical protein